MTLPAYALGLVFCLLLASLFHVWKDGGAIRLLFYFALSMAGGALGQWIGAMEGWTILAVGPLNLGLVGFGSLLFLGIGHWLSLVEIRGAGHENDRV
jgi:hypothetical protein